MTDIDDGPFSPVRDIQIEYVDSVAGAGKTRRAIAVSCERAAAGAKIIICMPTLKLIAEMAAYAESFGLCPVCVITHDASSSIDVKERILRHITGRMPQGGLVRGLPEGGHLLFITHAAFLRFATQWPAEARDFELIIDEVIDPILTRQPFRLYDNGWLLTSFLEAQDVVLPKRAQAQVNNNKNSAAAKLRAMGLAPWSGTDDARLIKARALADEQSGAGAGERAAAVKRLEAKKQVWEEALEDPVIQQLLDDIEQEKRPYFQLIEQESDWIDDPEYLLKRRIMLAGKDEGYALVKDVAEWLFSGACLFTDASRWTAFIEKTATGRDRGQISISGFRRPEGLVTAFRRVTIMSALFRHTMLYDLWSELGVSFVPSTDIHLDVHKTPLGTRQLNISYVTDQGWSKALRDRCGGIGPVLTHIISSGAIRPEAVCVILNKDDGGEEDRRIIKAHVPHGIAMPPCNKGRNEWRHIHQMIHCAAMNSHTPDIKWMEQMLGISGDKQRIARTGQEVYQSICRLSLRDPNSTADINVVVMDKDVAIWLAEWFDGVVNVSEIPDPDGIIKRKGKPGRKCEGDKPLTGAERAKRAREKKKALG